ncbi:hypothetical protein PCASD_15471 [Puccinia coronata f. sp. avenae]|uniref:Uncharacterized protein n=1 Tax=Puccinia coronata f. sp. avenae TaxID=200324 RepID=A0A2N5TZJ1_9BASI|nr:hypothetical protein PCASD_15471 [Puccinia coronata f. sp. avenae]
MINLLLDYNNFLEHELDQEENEASVERRSNLQPRSSTAYNECSKSPSPSVISTITAPREKSAFPPKNPSKPESHKKNEMFEVQSSNDSDLPKIIVRSSHADAAVKLNPKSKHNDMKVVFKRSPPWITDPILDSNDLSWDQFGISEPPSVFQGRSEVDWTHGLRLQLDPDGVYMNEKLCTYRIQYHPLIAKKKFSKVMSAQIYDSGIVYPMITECSLLRKKPRT